MELQKLQFIQIKKRSVYKNSLTLIATIEDFEILQCVEEGR